MDAQRKLLDALMGASRNGDSVAQKHFTDKDVCKPFLCGLCPHDLFTNTKNELGECPKLHSVPMRLDYEEARKKKDYGFERELEQVLARLVEDCDRKLAKAQKRIDEQEASQGGSVDSEAAELLTAEIADTVKKAEEAAEAGNVEECKKLLARAEELKQQKAAMSSRDGVPMPSAAPVTVAGITLVPGIPGIPSMNSQQQKLRVCDACASLLSVYDSDRRLADHFNGKLHIGYALCRQRLAELRKTLGASSSSALSSSRGDDRRDDRPRDDRRDDRGRDDGRYRDPRDRDYRRDDRRDDRGRDDRRDEHRDDRGRDDRRREYDDRDKRQRR